MFFGNEESPPKCIMEKKQKTQKNTNQDQKILKHPQFCSAEMGHQEVVQFLIL